MLRHLSKPSVRRSTNFYWPVQASAEKKALTQKYNDMGAEIYDTHGGPAQIIRRGTHSSRLYWSRTQINEEFADAYFAELEVICAKYPVPEKDWNKALKVIRVEGDEPDWDWPDA